MSDVELWSATDASNNDAPPDGFPEGMNRSDYNNSGRAVMGAVRRFFNASEFVNVYAEPARVVSKVTDTQIRIAGVDVTGDFPVDRRVQITDGTTTVSGFVTAAAFAAGDTTVTVVLDSGVVPAATNKVLVHSGKTLKKIAFRNTVPLDSVFDVRQDFGATGDGVTNDQAAIQAAIDAAEVNGGLVFFPRGKYVVNSQLQVFADNVILMGEGPRASQILSGVTASSTLVIGDLATDMEGCEIRDLGFTMKPAAVATAGAMIFWQRAPYGVMSNVWIFGATLGGVPCWKGIETHGSSPCFRHSWRDVLVMDTLDRGVLLQNASRMSLENVRVFGAINDGFLIDCVDYSSFRGCSSHGGTQNGWLIRQSLAPVAPVLGTRALEFVGCVGSENGQHGFRVLKGFDLTFSACRAEGNGTGGAIQDGFLFDGSAVPLSDLIEVLVSGCVATRNDRDGFRFTSVAKAQITGCMAQLNSSAAAAGSGITLDACEDCLVEGNNVVERSAGGTQKIGVRIVNASQRNLIAGNIAANNATKNFDDAASGTNLWRGNRSPDARPTVASAATVTLPNLADDLVEITGVTQIDNFAGGEIGKVVRCYFPSALTIRHLGGGTGNIRLAGSVNVTTTAGSILSFEKIEATPIYREVGRTLA